MYLSAILLCGNKISIFQIINLINGAGHWLLCDPNISEKFYGGVIFCQR